MGLSIRSLSSLALLGCLLGHTTLAFAQSTAPLEQSFPLFQPRRTTPPQLNEVSKETLRSQIPQWLSQHAQKQQNNINLPIRRFELPTSQDIIIIQGDSSFVKNSRDGLYFDDQSGIPVILQSVLENHGDQYDFISVFTTFDDPTKAMYYMGLINEVTGLGRCRSENDFGCTFNRLEQDLKLKGFVFLNSVNAGDQFNDQTYGFRPFIDDPASMLYAILGQEIGHAWGSGLTAYTPGTESFTNEMLGRDDSHWSSHLNADGSVMDGWQWEDQGDGRFIVVDQMNKFSHLDLYAMGLLAPSEVPSFFWIEDAKWGFNLNHYGIRAGDPMQNDIQLYFPGANYLRDSFGFQVSATGQRVDASIHDVVRAIGPRCPSAHESQKTWRQAIVLVTRPNDSQAVIDTELTKLQTVMQTWQQWWSDKTYGRSSICMNDDATCGQANVIFQHQYSTDLSLGSQQDITVRLGSDGNEIRKPSIYSELSGAGAAFAQLENVQWSSTEIMNNSDEFVSTMLHVNDNYPVGEPLLMRTAFTALNAPHQKITTVFMPGLFKTGSTHFTNGQDGFEVEQASDNGSFTYNNDVHIECSSLEFDPPQDASQEGNGAWIASNLSGKTSIVSPLFESDKIITHLSVSSWNLGKSPANMTIEVSKNNGDYQLIPSNLNTNNHEWVPQVINLSQTIGNDARSIRVRISAEAQGDTTVGIDDVSLWSSNSPIVNDDDDDGDDEIKEIHKGCGGCTSDSAGIPSLFAMAFWILARRRRTSNV